MKSLYIVFCLFIWLSLPLSAGTEVDSPVAGPDFESYTLTMKEFKTLEIIDMDGMRIKNFRFQSTLNERRDEFLGLYVRESKRVYYYVARPLGGKPIKSIYWRTSKGDLKGLLLNGRTFADYWRDEQKALEARKRTFEAVPLHKADFSSFYSKWAGMEGVSATYISKSMFKMIEKVPQIQLDRPVDLTPIIQSLDGLYMLEFDNTQRDTRLGCLIKNIQDIVDGHESLMEKREGDLATILLIKTEGKMVSSFILMRKDNDFNHCQLVCLEGAIPQDEFKKVITEGLNQ